MSLGVYTRKINEVFYLFLPPWYVYTANLQCEIVLETCKTIINFYYVEVKRGMKGKCSMIMKTLLFVSGSAGLALRRLWSNESGSFINPSLVKRSRCVWFHL
jgi:hypothetical protein